MLHESWLSMPLYDHSRRLANGFFLIMYLLRTHLLENPDVIFYYKGTAREKGVPFALNTIVAFKPSDALVFDNEQVAINYCNLLNQDKQALVSNGYSKFEIVTENVTVNN